MRRAGVIDDRFARTKLLLTGAVGFVEAGRSLLERPGMFHWPAFFVNICYAMELAPKAFLVHRGIVPYADLRQRYGHRLMALFEAMSAAGYRSVDEEIVPLLKLLSPLHQHHFLRYLEGAEVILPDAKQAMSLADNYVKSIGRQVPVGEI